MRLQDAVTVAIRAYLAKFRSVAPAYFFVPSAIAIGRVVLFAGVAVAGLLLGRSGALAEIGAILREAGPIAIDEQSEGGSDPFSTGQQSGNELTETQEAIGDVLVSEPEALLIILVAVLGTYLLASIVLWLSAAGRLHGLFSIITDPRGTPAVTFLADEDRPPAPDSPRRGIPERDRQSGIEDPVGPLGWRRTERSPEELAATRPSAQDVEGDAGGLLTGAAPASSIGDDETEPDRASPIALGDRSRPLRAAVDGTATHGLTFLGLLGLELFVYVASVLLLVVPVLGPLLWLFVALPATRTYFAFAKVAAVVEGTGVSGALGGAYGYIRSRPGQAIAYGFLSVVVLVGVLFVSGLLALLDAGGTGPLLMILVAFPLLDALKTVLYADYSPNADVIVPDQSRQSAVERLRGELEAGWATLKQFTVGHPGLVVANLALFAGGAYLAWVWAAGAGGLIETSIERRVSGSIPPGMMVNYFANNWSVGIAQAFSGIGFGLPSVLSVLFNGLLIGAFARAEVALVPFLAFLIPHGLVEIPALVLSGAIGLYAGVVAVRTFRGRIDRETLTDEIEYLYRATIGLAVLFAVAAVIEAWISPYYWQLLGV